MTESESWHLIRQGRDEPFIVTGDVIVGRSKQADLRIEEGYVSRRHARLWLEAGRLMVEDLGSANGTFLNGERLEQQQPLLPGDRVCFDETEFYIEAPERTDADPNATAHRPPDDEDAFPVPDRPAHWDGGATQPPVDVNPSPVASAPTPPAAPIAPPAKPVRAPTEAAFNLDTGAFELDAPGRAPSPAANTSAGTRSPVRRRRPISISDIRSIPSSTFPSEAPGLEEEVPAERVSPMMAALRENDEPLPAGGSGTEVMLPDEAPKTPPAEASGDDPGLLIMTGSDEGALYQLAEGRVSIGRSPECDIQIEESSVSKRHAELVIEPGHCRVHDISRSNGVYVNGHQVDDVVLNPGDVIRLGRIELMFDAYLKLAEGGGSEEGVPWLLLVGSFLGTVGLGGGRLFRAPIALGRSRARGARNLRCRLLAAFQLFPESRSIPWPSPSPIAGKWNSNMARWTAFRPESVE